MEDFLRSVGMIYIVVGTIAIIFTAITLFLFVIDKKISRLEQNIKDNG